MSGIQGSQGDSRLEFELKALTGPGWVFTARDVVRLPALTPRRADQLRRLELLHAPDRSDLYTFRDLVALRVARTLLDQGVTVRQIRRALEVLGHPVMR